MAANNNTTVQADICEWTVFVENPPDAAGLES